MCLLAESTSFGRKRVFRPVESISAGMTVPAKIDDSLPLPFGYQRNEKKSSGCSPPITYNVLNSLLATSLSPVGATYFVPRYLEAYLTVELQMIPSCRMEPL